MTSVEIDSSSPASWAQYVATRSSIAHWHVFSAAALTVIWPVVRWERWMRSSFTAARYYPRLLPSPASCRMHHSTCRHDGILAIAAMEIYAAGAAAAFTVDMIVYPLDTLKTRYQSQDYLRVYGPGPRDSALAIRGLHQGVGIVVLATLPAAGVFSTYERAKDMCAGRLPVSVPEALVHASASAVAEMASCLILAPAEVVKQNAQMLRRQGPRAQAPARASASLQALGQLAGAGAAGRLLTGYTALVARNVPFTGLQFPIFEYLRSRLWGWRRRGRRDQPAGLVETGLMAGGSAGAAGALAALLTAPSDAVKTRMMVAAGQDKRGRLTLESKQGSLVVARAIYRERGVRGLFRGALFRCAWTALGSSLYLWGRTTRPSCG